MAVPSGSERECEQPSHDKSVKDVKDESSARLEDQNRPKSSPAPSTDKIPRAEQTSHFFRLPRECRDSIYGYLLSTRNYIAWPSEKTRHELTPWLLSTCQQIHEEATPILYTSNLFCFSHPSNCTALRCIADPLNAPKIHTVMFKIKSRLYKRLWRNYFANNHPPHLLAADLPGLKQLFVLLDCSYWRRDRSPEENLSLWFKTDVFADLATQIDNGVNAETAIFARQRIPQPQFDYLQTVYTQHVGAEDPNPWITMLTSTRLRVKPFAENRRSVCLELLSPQDESPI